MDSKITNVYKTENLRKFKLLLNNREVKETRVKAIIKSIQDNGYFISPIITNERFEIIDGQGRYTAAKRLGLPVYYISIPGIGIKECRTMNFCNSNWKVSDYVYSYSQDGNESYIYLQNLLTAYRKTIGDNTMYAIAAQMVETGGGAKDTIVSGNLHFSKDEYKDAVDLCDYLKNFALLFKSLNGRRDVYYAAIRFMYTLPQLDKKRLIDKCMTYQRDMTPCVTVMTALEMFQDIYNKRSSKKAYFVDEYRKRIDDRDSTRNRKFYEMKKGGAKQ